MSVEKKINDRQFYKSELYEAPISDDITEIGDYSFGECRKLESVEFPAGLKRIGKYAFYNCRGLKSIVMHGCIEEIEDGAFKNCENVKNLIMFNVSKDDVRIRNIMCELEEQFSAEIHFKDGSEARLVFPKNNSEVVANEPARNSREIINGAGGYYRICANTNKIDFMRYDELFELAVREEKSDTAAEIVLARLLFPYELKEKHLEKYLDYLNRTDTRKDFLNFIIKNELSEELKTLKCKNYVETDFMKDGAELSRTLGNAKMAGIFMNFVSGDQIKRKKSWRID